MITAATEHGLNTGWPFDVILVLAFLGVLLLAFVWGGR